jgi:hypothetical protein
VFTEASAISLSKPTPLADPPEHWAPLESVLREHYDVDAATLEGARVLYSAIAAHDLPGPPTWPMIIAPPSSIKTELLAALEGLPSVHTVDSVTPNTFISGQVKKPGDSRRPASLLHRIGPSGIVLIPDFSTIQEMRNEACGEVLSQLRRIYDGGLKKEFGTAEDVPEWRGRLTIAVAATPSVENAHNVHRALGERFITVRWGRPGGYDVGRGIRAAQQGMAQDRKKVRDDLQTAVRLLFQDLPATDIDVSEEASRILGGLAEFVARARTYVKRDTGSRDVLSVPEPEGSPRLAQEFCQLARGSARLGRRSSVTAVDLAIAKRAARDSVQPIRWHIIAALRRGQPLPEMRLDGRPVPGSTRKYACEDLRELGLLIGTEGGYGLSADALELLKHAGL